MKYERTYEGGLPVLKENGSIIAFKVNSIWYAGRNLLQAARSPWIWSREFNKDIQV